MPAIPSRPWHGRRVSLPPADGLAAGAGWLKQHVLVDLDQAHFGALVDLCGRVGSIPTSLLDLIHHYASTDDERVRQQYLNTAHYIARKPGMGPVFGKRRAERVWPPQPNPDQRQPPCFAALAASKTTGFGASEDTMVAQHSLHP